MAAITWDDVTAFAPRFSTVDTDAQTAILAMVNEFLNVAVFTDGAGGEDSPKLKVARVYLACHVAASAAQGNAGAAGPVTLEMVDQVQRSYAQPGGGVAFDSLDSTGYGKLYRMLIRTTTARAPVVL